jgi:hypothetical protein
MPLERSNRAVSRLRERNNKYSSFANCSTAAAEKSIDQPQSIENEKEIKAIFDGGLLMQTGPPPQITHSLVSMLIVVNHFMESLSILV